MSFSRSSRQRRRLSKETTNKRMAHCCIGRFLPSRSISMASRISSKVENRTVSDVRSASFVGSKFAGYRSTRSHRWRRQAIVHSYLNIQSGARLQRTRTGENVFRVEKVDMIEIVQIDLHLATDGQRNARGRFARRNACTARRTRQVQTAGCVEESSRRAVTHRRGSHRCHSPVVLHPSTIMTSVR